MSKKNMDDLRDVLFEALAECKDKSKPLDVARMRAISEISQRITDTARVEVDFMRTIGENRGSGFIPLQADKDDQKKPEKLKNIATSTGVQSIESVAGGRVIRHTLR
jgi:hypothetical protein